MSKARVKGTGGENEAVEFLSFFFDNVERKALHGTRDSGDLTGPYTVSVKRQEKWKVHEWLEELANQVTHNKDKPGFVMARRNREDWVFLVPADTMKLFLRELTDG